MTVVTNTFEGGSNSTVITTANSGGSGTAFPSIVGSPAYTTVRAAHGTMSARLPQASSLGYTLSGSNSTRWVRAYLYSATSWEADQGVLTLSAGFLLTWTVQCSPSSVTVAHFNGSTETVIATIAQAPAVGAWMRIELSAINNTSGSCEVRLYTSADSPTPTGTATGSRSSTAAAWSSVEWYNYATADTWVDSVGWSDEDWLGSAAPSVQLRSIVSGSSVAVHRASSW